VSDQYVVVQSHHNPLASGWPGDPVSKERIVFGPDSKSACENYKRHQNRYSDMGSPNTYSIKPAKVTVEY
jgi:hypothetical protein